MKRQQIVLVRPGDASFLLPLILFLRGNGLRNSISFGEPKLYVIQLRLGVCVLGLRRRKQKKKYKKNRQKGEKKKEERTHLSKQQQSVNIMQRRFEKKPRMSWLRAPKLPAEEMENKIKTTKLFFYNSVFPSRPFGSSASISVTPLCCWLNTSESCVIDPVVHPFYYLFSHPKAAFRFDSATVVEKHKFSSPFAVRGRINGCEIKP